MGAKNKLSAEEKKNKRLAKWLMSLNKEQKELMSEYCVEQSKSDIVAYFNAYERVLRPAIYKLVDDEIEGEKILSSIVCAIGLEGLQLHQFKNGSVEYMKKIDESRIDIINKYEELKVKNFSEKDILEEIQITYPKLTKNAIRNVIAEYRRDLKKDERQLKGGDVNAALGYIFEKENEPKDADKNKFAPNQEDVVQAEFVKPNTEKQRFKILKKTVIVDVEGAHGVYHVENGTVSVIGDGSDLSFGNPKAVKTAAKLQKDKLNKMIEEVEEKEAEILAVMEIYK